jgi:hypothetical protein
VELKTRCYQCGKFIPVEEPVLFENQIYCRTCYETIIKPTDVDPLKELEEQEKEIEPPPKRGFWARLLKGSQKN